MNWEAAGAIGEIVGAAVWDSQMSFVSIHEALAAGDRLSDVMYRAVAAPESLDAYEQYLAHRFVRSFFQRMEAQCALHQGGILDDEVWRLRCGYAQGLTAYPRIRGIWALEKRNSMFREDFVEALESTPPTELGGFLGVDLEAMR